MTDETRDEIVRLAQKGETASQIADRLYEQQQIYVDVEQVQQVIDEAEAMSGECMTNDTLRGQPVPHDHGCDCESCMYEARQSGKPDPKPGRG